MARWARRVGHVYDAARDGVVLAKKMGPCVGISSIHTEQTLKKISVHEKTAQEIKEGPPLAATGTLLFFGCPNEITLFGDPQPLSSIGMDW